MGDVAAAAAFVQAPVVLIHIAAGIAEFGGRGSIVEELRIGVMRQGRESVAEATFQLDEAGVIGGIADGRIDERYVAELREWPEILRVAGPQEIRRNLVDAERIRSGQVVSEGSQVSDIKKEIPREFPLEVKIRLIEVAIPAIPLIGVLIS